MKFTTRLSAFFLTSLAIVLVAFSTALFGSAWSYLHRQVDDRLTSALAVLAAAAEIHPEGVEWEASERELTLGRDSGPDQLRWIVFDGEGRPIDHSKNLDDAGPSPEWSPGTGTAALPKRLLDRGGRPWSLAQRRLGLTDATGPGIYHDALFLTVAAPLDPVDRTLASLGVWLAVVSLAVWTLASLLGRWLVRRALAPLTRMVGSAQELDATEPGWSLPLGGTGDELDDLGRAFNDLLGRLHEAFERQRRFAGDASHQLRTPLTALVGQIEVALRRDRTPEEYRRVLGLLRGQTGGLIQIVEALLFLGRADAEAGLPDSIPFDLAAWLGPYVAGHALAGSIDLDVDGPAWVQAHPPLLGQLLDNLLDNASKYGRPAASMIVRLRSDSDAVRLAVEDTGPGIDPADLPRVFEPFFRSSQARRLGRPGVGLGLAVAQRIATAFGGAIVVESEAGRGCRFLVGLPRIVPVDADLRAGPTPLVEVMP